MAVLLPTGTYTVSVQTHTLDAHRMPVFGAPVAQWTGIGRVRTSGAGVNFALDPSAWPAVAWQDNDSAIRITGPDVDGTTRTWIVTTPAALRKGNNKQLDPLSYVQASGERADQ